MQARPTAVVVGAGINGLTAALRLAENGWRVEVLGATTNELLFVLFLLGLVLVGTKAGDLGEALFRLWIRMSGPRAGR